MRSQINCKYNDFVHCKHKLKKRSLFGLGAKICDCYLNGNNCPLREFSIKPPPPYPFKHK